MAPEQVTGIARLIKHRKTRSTMIFLILCLVLLAQLVYLITRGEPPRMSVRVLMCKACDHREIYAFTNIKEVKCSKCGGELGYEFKCMNCDYEYAHLVKKIYQEDKISKKEARKQRIEDAKCPNCGSINTGPHPHNPYAKKNMKKEKK